MKHKEEIDIKRKFDSLSKEVEPKPALIKHCICAFIFGGAICDIGQIFFNIFTDMDLPKDMVGTLVAIFMVFIGATLTGIGIYDKLANIAGAGTVVPITGFANSIVSEAIESKKEGFVFGVGAKMFTIAGPVLVYGISTSVIIGIIHYMIHYVFK